MVDAVEDDAVAVRLAYHYSKALAKCEGLKTLFAHFLRFKDLTAIWGKQPSLWGGRNETFKGRTQVCRHQREEIGHSLAEITTPNFPIQIGDSEVVEGSMKKT
jgi:hypothetical protein